MSLKIIKLNSINTAHLELLEDSTTSQP